MTDPHSQAISPYVFRGSAIQSTSSKESESIFGETSVRLRKSPTIIPNRCPEPASQSSKSSAGQATQILHTCEGGGAGMHGHGHARAHPYHGHAFTGTYAFTAMVMHARIRTMTTLSRVCARPWSCACRPLGTPSTRPARAALADLHSNPTHSNSLRRRGGHGYDVCGVMGGRYMLWSGLKPDRQSGLGSRQKSGLKVPYPGNLYS